MLVSNVSKGGWQCGPVGEHSIWPKRLPRQFRFHQGVRCSAIAAVLLRVAHKHLQVVWVLSDVDGNGLSLLMGSRHTFREGCTLRETCLGAFQSRMGGGKPGSHVARFTGIVGDHAREARVARHPVTELLELCYGRRRPRRRTNRCSPACTRCPARHRKPLPRVCCGGRPVRRARQPSRPLSPGLRRSLIWRLRCRPDLTRSVPLGTGLQTLFHAGD